MAASSSSTTPKLPSSFPIDVKCTLGGPTPHYWCPAMGKHFMGESPTTHPHPCVYASHPDVLAPPDLSHSSTTKRQLAVEWDFKGEPCHWILTHKLDALTKDLNEKDLTFTIGFVFPLYFKPDAKASTSGSCVVLLGEEDKVVFNKHADDTLWLVGGDYITKRRFSIKAQYSPKLYFA